MSSCKNNLYTDENYFTFLFRHRYVDTPKTFEEAESTCRHFSPGPYGFGHLASVHSTEEYEALASMVPGVTIITSNV